MSTPTPSPAAYPPLLRRGLARRVEIADRITDLGVASLVHVPSRILIDGVDITRLLVKRGLYLGYCLRTNPDADGPATVLELDLVPGHVRVTPDAYGPDTSKVELLDPDGPINLICPRPAVGEDLVVEFEREEPWNDDLEPGELVRRERLRIFAEEIHFSRRLDS